CPINQTNQIDEIDQMNQISFDARSEGQSGDSPMWIRAGGCSKLAHEILPCCNGGLRQTY
ncbi:MAG: hypothetical protein Q8S75_09730, partial [Nitrospirota bacterium]|nr:hypothetical protein [Nitrospirota bacterium]